MSGLILLTGATGCVGRQVLKELIERGSIVRLVVRNDVFGELARLPEVESLIVSPDLFAEDSDWWAKVCIGVDIVIHVAWYAEPSKYLHSSKNIDCLVGTMKIAKGAATANVRRFVGIGTCLEYDLSGGWLSEQTPLQPLSSYAGAKAATYMALSPFLQFHEVEFVWCRLFYLYGEGEDIRRLVPYVRSRLTLGKNAKLTSGKQIRDFLDVFQASCMIVDVALSDIKGPINICSGVPITVRQLAEQIADEYGRRDLLEFGAIPENQLDPPCVVGVRREITDRSPTTKNSEF